MSQHDQILKRANKILNMDIFKKALQNFKFQERIRKYEQKLKPIYFEYPPSFCICVEKMSRGLFSKFQINFESTNII